ncbi:MAG TPA: ATP-binding cassette domain-containing protein [Gemmatimonadales bacterium]|nr:ATP-binding cassette domain-containing protein [Gemmatimonadales bacterium]
MTGEPLLRIERLCIRYGAREVLRSLSLEVARGEIVALMGPSGVGKTTALRAVAALQPFDEGSIVVDGLALHPGPVPPESRLVPLRRSVGFVFQGHALFEHLTALDNVTLALRYVLKKSRAASDGVATTLLASLDVGARAQALPAQLSGGEAQRVAIARALAPDPALLLMDEPTAALDPARRSALATTLRRLCDQGRSLLVATHDADFAAQADRVVTLS